MVKQSYVPFEQELEKNPELKTADIENLREWCEKQPHLSEIMDHELALFLHSNYYRMEPTKVNIETYYTLRTHVMEFFTSRGPINNKELRQAFDIITFTPMSKTTKEGYKVIVIQVTDTDARKFNFNDTLKFLCMSLDELLYHEGTIKGYIFLVDMINSTVGHAGRMSPMAAKKILTYLQDGVPLRLKGLHFINTNSVMEIFMSIIKPFMKKDLLEMLYLQSLENLKSLEKYVPLEIIPNELGDKAGSLLDLHKAHVKKIENLRDWFVKEESRARINESKRLEKKKVSLELFGDYDFEGSFEKLDFD